MMSIHTTIVIIDSIGAMIAEAMVYKSTVVAMIVFNFDSHVCSFRFKCFTGFDSRFAGKIT
jgi:hypothetical protein